MLTLADPFLLKQSLDSKKLKELEIIYQNAFYICISWYGKVCWFQVKNAKISRTQGVCHVIHMFLDLLWVRYNCAKFHHSRMCVTEFREEQLSTSACKNWEKIIYIFNARRLTVLFLKMWNLYHFKMWLSFT